MSSSDTHLDSTETSTSAIRRLIEANGYAVIPQVIPQDLLSAVTTDIWRHTRAHSSDRSSWYRRPQIRPIGVSEMYHYQSMWNIRQHPALHCVFSEIHGTERLWVSIDRVGFKPPIDRENHPEFVREPQIHWDEMRMEQYPNIPFYVQGVLALEDTDETMGGFVCVPSIYRDLARFLDQHRMISGKKFSRFPDTTGHEIVKVPARAGDLIVWSSLLPHTGGMNESEDRVRLCQYVTMNPVWYDEEDRKARIACWQGNTKPPYQWAFGDKRKIEERRRTPAELTSLGRKLLGIDNWE